MPAAREWVTPSSHAKKKKVKFTKSAASPNPNRDTAPPSTGAKPGPRGKTTNPFAPLGEKTSSESSGNPPETQDEAEDESPTDETLPNFEKRSTGPPKPPSPAIEEGEVVSSDADIPDSVARALLDALQEKRQGNQLPTAMAPLARVRASQLQHCIDNKTEPSESTIQATLDIVAMESGPADPAALSDKVSLVYVLLFEVGLNNFTIAGFNVIYLGEYYRILSSAVLHGGLLHILFNMMSFVNIGGNMEASFGTLAMFFIILWSIILSGVLYVAGQWAMTWLTHDLKHVQQHAVGFSGVIFTLALMESHRSTQPFRTVIGLIRVPTRMYPWVLLVLLSVMIPQISFMGHLSGILVGVMHVYGVTKPLLPSPAYLIEMENYAFVRDGIAQRPDFVPCPQSLPSVSEGSEMLSNTTRQICGPLLAAVGAARRSFGAITRARERGRGEGASGSRDGNAEA